MAEWSIMYEYTKDNVDKYAPESGGVYRLSYSNDYIVFYVGQSKNLKARLHYHLSPSEVDKCIKKHLSKYDCYFRFVEIASEDERIKVESEQIKKYTPECNG